jgi:hypothetical protein
MSTLEAAVYQKQIYAQSVIEDFSELARLNALLINHEACTDATVSQRNLLASSVGDKLLGERVSVEELEVARTSKERAIDRWGLANGEQLDFIANADRAAGNRRIHPRTHSEYVKNFWFRYRRTSVGKIDGIDAKRASLIVRPRLVAGLLDRHWIKVIGSNGEPLVSLEFPKASS